MGEDMARLGRVMKRGRVQASEREKSSMDAVFLSNHQWDRETFVDHPSVYEIQLINRSPDSIMSLYCNLTATRSAALAGDTAQDVRRYNAISTNVLLKPQAVYSVETKVWLSCSGCGSGYGTVVVEEKQVQHSIGDGEY